MNLNMMSLPKKRVRETNMSMCYLRNKLSFIVKFNLSRDGIGNDDFKTGNAHMMI